MSYLYHLIYFTQQLQVGGKTLGTGALSTLLRGAQWWRSLLMDHGRKEAMETTWLPVGGASQRPAIITQGLCRGSSLSPALPGSGCLLSLPGLPGPLPTPKPTPGFPALAFGAALLVLCFLASVHFNHQLCLCVSYCMVAKILGPHHLRQLQLQSVASFGEETLKFSKTGLCLCWGGGCVGGAGAGCSQKVLQPRKSYFRV